MKCVDKLISMRFKTFSSKITKIAIICCSAKDTFSVYAGVVPSVPDLMINYVALNVVEFRDGKRAVGVLGAVHRPSAEQ